MGIANILASNYKTATFRGKLIVSDSEQHNIFYLGDQEADDIVNNNRPFSVYKSSVDYGPPYTYLSHDDSTPVTLDDTISVSQVPDNAESSFVLEPAYVVRT